MVELQRLVPSSGARIFVKWEPANPTGSMKDRMAVEVIRSAAADGRLKPGDTVVEYTAGTTGISLALVCAALGYRLHVVFSDAFSVEKRKTMLALGAEITDEPSDGGRITEELIKRMIATAAEISTRPGHWWSDQLEQPRRGARLRSSRRGDLETDRRACRRVRACRGHRPLDPWHPSGVR